MLKISTVIFIVIYVIIGLSIAYFLYQINIFTDHKIITSLDSIEKESYSITHRQIRNDNHNDYIFTTDKVFYKFIINSKIPDHSRITYEFNVTSAGEYVKNEIGEYNLQGNGNVREFYFYPKNSGTYEINVAMNFYNPDTGFDNALYAQEVHTINNIQVWNLSDKLQLDSNENSRNLTILSIMIAGTAVLITIYQTKKLRDEHNMTLRAWVGDTGSKIIFVNVFNDQNDFKSYDDWKKLTDDEKNLFGEVGLELHIILKNFGSVPAVDIKSRLYVHPDREPTQTEIESVEPGDPFVIMPQNESPTRFFLQNDIATYFLNSSIPSYFSLEIVYKSSNSKKQRIFGVSFARKTGSFSIIRTWDEKTMLKK